MFKTVMNTESVGTNVCWAGVFLWCGAHSDSFSHEDNSLISEAKLLSKNLVEAVGFTAIVSEEGCVTIRGFWHDSFPVNISFLI